MSWLFFAILGTIFRSLPDILTKKALFKHDEYAVMWARIIFPVPILLIILIIAGIPKVDIRFWFIIALMLPVEVLLEILFFKAFKLSHISLIVPFTSFTPVFLLVSSFFLLNEMPKSTAVLGIILIMIGGYLVNTKGRLKSILQPILDIKKEKGIQFILIVTLCWSIIFPLGKIASFYSSPFFFTAVYFSLLSLLLTPVFFKKSQSGLSGIKNDLKIFSFIGLTSALSITFNWLAVALGFVSSAKAISSFDTLLTTVIGGKYFHEDFLKTRIAGAVLMVLGALLIIFF